MFQNFNEILDLIIRYLWTINCLSHTKEFYLWDGSILTVKFLTETYGFGAFWAEDSILKKISNFFKLSFQSSVSNFAESKIEACHNVKIISLK